MELLKRAASEKDSAQSFYGSPPPNFSLTNRRFRNQLPVFPYLLKYGAPCHPDFIVRYPFPYKKLCEAVSFMASFLVSSSHDDGTRVKENHWFGAGGYRRISLHLYHQCVSLVVS